MDSLNIPSLYVTLRHKLLTIFEILESLFLKKCQFPFHTIFFIVAYKLVSKIYPAKIEIFFFFEAFLEVTFCIVSPWFYLVWQHVFVFFQTWIFFSVSLFFFAFFFITKLNIYFDNFLSKGFFEALFSIFKKPIIIDKQKLTVGGIRLTAICSSFFRYWRQDFWK